MNKEPIMFLNHMLDAIDNIELFMNNLTRQQFNQNVEKQYAIIKALEIIGEAAKNLPLEFTKKYPLIPWSDIMKTRDKMSHHYFGIDLNIVWGIIINDLSDLKEKLLAIKKHLD